MSERLDLSADVYEYDCVVVIPKWQGESRSEEAEGRWIRTRRRAGGRVVMSSIILNKDIPAIVGAKTTSTMDLFNQPPLVGERIIE